MNTKFYIFIISIICNYTSGQSTRFRLEEKFTSLDRAKQISDSLKLPTLVSKEHVFSFDESCYKKFTAGFITERDNDGASNERFKDGNSNERNIGGSVAERQKKGKKNSRNKGGLHNDRDDDGDVNDRNKEGKLSNRNSDGLVGEGPHCSNTSKGKILIYTRHKIIEKTSYIYFENKTFNNKYFKIIKL